MSEQKTLHCHKPKRLNRDRTQKILQNEKNIKLEK